MAARTRVGAATTRAVARLEDTAPEVELEALVVTHSFDSGQAGDPYAATIRLRGERVGTGASRDPRDRFLKEQVIAGVVPGSGQMSVTTVIYGLAPGEWSVSAELMRPASRAGGGRLPERRERIGSESIGRALWSWRRWALTTDLEGPVKTRFAPLAPLARMPAVIPGVWVTLAALGIIVALVMQALILAHEGVSVGPSLFVSLVVVVSSLFAAKLWYAALHPGPWRQWISGWSVDGFVFVGPPVAIVGLIILNLPVGTVLDASAPGLFLGVAIGRIGCFLTGCCAGRCTRSRWGIWSSDRRVGARRVPAQLLESAAGFVIGIVAAVLVIGDVPTMPGTVFVAALAAYIVARQSLLRLRAEARTFSWRRSRRIVSENP